jgi:hypothetical protein
MRNVGGEMFKIFAIIVGLLVIPSQLLGGTRTAASCSRSDVTFALNAAGDGDIVVIPSCPSGVTWSSSVILPRDKSITLQGQGETTLIKNGVMSSYLIQIGANPGKSHRLTNLKIQMNGGGGEYTVSVGDDGNRWRIDHVIFDELSSKPIYISKGWGVIDNCTFNWTTDASQVIEITVETGGGDSTNGWNWDNQVLDLGTANAVYIENNVFNSKYIDHPVIDCGRSGKYVFRYNLVNGGFVGHHDSCTGTRSCFSWEIYNNTILRTQSGKTDKGIAIRGGTGVVFENTITGNYNTPIVLQNYRSVSNMQCGGESGDGIGLPIWGSHCDSTADKRCHSRWIGCTMDSQCSGYGRCDTNIDGQTDSTGYPCVDQIGRSNNQSLKPALFWGNNAVPVVDNWNGAYPNSADHIKLNRDYCVNPPGCSGQSCYATCNSVSVKYIAYTYPHPLTEGDLIFPPSRLRIVQ